MSTVQGKLFLELWTWISVLALEHLNRTISQQNLLAQGKIKYNLVLWMRVRRQFCCISQLDQSWSMFSVCFGTGGISEGEGTCEWEHPSRRLEVAHSSFPTQPAAKSRTTPGTSTAVIFSICFQNLWSQNQLQVFCVLPHPSPWLLSPWDTPNMFLCHGCSVSLNIFLVPHKLFFSHMQEVTYLKLFSPLPSGRRDKDNTRKLHTLRRHFPSMKEKRRDAVFTPKAQA